MVHMFNVNLPSYEDELTVMGKYCKGSPAVWYLKNGDPGYPEEPDSFDIYWIMYDGKYVTEDISDDELCLIEDQCIEQAHQYDD